MRNMPRVSVLTDEDSLKVHGRACDACHRMKIRCDRPREPPCRRCATMKEPCTFTFDTTSPYRIKRNQDRMAHMERQMTALQSNMAQMSQTLQQLVQQREKSTPHSPSGHNQNSSVPTLDQWVRSIDGTSSLPSLPSAISEEVREAPVVQPIDEEDDRYLFEAPSEAPMKQIIYRDEEERLRQENSVVAARARPALIAMGTQESDMRSVEDELHRKSSRPVPTRRGNLGQRHPDPVDSGLCSESQGKHLFDLFFEGAHSFLPVFDRTTDTWDSAPSLRARSSFCITAVLLVGQMVADADGSTGSMRSKLLEHAEKIAMTTLFSPAASIEAVQAMIILANWGDTAWRPGNHALSLALDMDLHHCLPYLETTGMGQNKSVQELEADRLLVAGARVWLGMCKTHIELCSNHGRPNLLENDSSIQLGRRFLCHPLTTKEDSRCVVLCEAQAIKAPIHKARAMTKRPPEQDLQPLIIQATQKLDEWERYWSQYYSQLGVSDDNFLVTELVTIKCYSLMDINSTMLWGVRSERDIQRLSDQSRQSLIAAGRAAATLVARAARGAENAKLRHGNRNVRLGLATAARYLIRLAILLPESIDLRQASMDVEFLADQLARFPDFHFSQFLRHVVLKARKRQQMPPRSLSNVSPVFAQDKVDSGEVGLDFLLAEDVFASTDWMNDFNLISSDQPNTTFPLMPLDDLPVLSTSALGMSLAAGQGSEKPFWLP